jgi:DNA polymerase-1
MNRAGSQELQKILGHGKFRYNCVLVDGNNLVVRCYHGYARSKDLSFPGTYGAINFLTALYHTLDVSYSQPILVWDTGHSPRRSTLFPGYKQREKKEGSVDLRGEIRHAQDLIGMLPIPFALGDSGPTEADDVIFTLTRDVLELQPDAKVLIVSEDHDMIPLLSANVHLYWPVKKRVHTPDTISEEIGIPLERYTFFKALRGDPSDAIPGVPGIGEVLAKEIVLAYASMEDLFGSPGKLPDRKRVRNAVLQVRKFRDTVRRNMDLIHLAEVPYRISTPLFNREMLFAILTTSGMATLRSGIMDSFGGSA